MDSGLLSIAVIGPASGIGIALVPRLVQSGHRVRIVPHLGGRGCDDWPIEQGRIEILPADLERSETVPNALAGADVVISLAHARYTSVVLASLPATCRRVLLTGSTRRFTALPDPAADEVRRGEAALTDVLRRGSSLEGVMLHTSLIYGHAGDRAVHRLRTLIRRWPRALPLVLPLPNGGRHTVQPVHVEDVAAAFAAAVTAPEAPGPAIVIAGLRPLPYREFMRRCAEAEGRRLVVLSVPVALLSTLSSLAAVIGLRPPVTSAELRRMTEDKAFDVTPMRCRLGVEPREFSPERTDRAGVVSSS